MLQLLLSQTGDPVAFKAAVETHRSALAEHRIGKINVPVPVHSDLVASVIACVPDVGPVADRKPDSFVVLPYEIVDDTPKTPEAERALAVLRETIATKE